MAVQRRVAANITEIVSYSDKVKLFRLKPVKKLPRFKPGQFLHLAIDPYDPSFNWPESRVFSILNSPSRMSQIEILVSKIGVFTSRMFDALKENDEVWIKLPYGTFNFDDSINRNSILIAGGTGISPFISFLQFAIDNQLNPQIKLFYGVRNPNLIIFEDIIKEASAKLSNFEYQIYSEDVDDVSSGLELSKGFMPVNEIAEKSLAITNPVFYLSGPPGMISAFDKELKSQGVDEHNIKFDQWE